MRVLVVGSINIDHVSYVESFPQIGETIKAYKYIQNLGGKGANQAVAIAQLSKKENQVSFFSTVHKQDHAWISSYLKNVNIDCKYLFTTEKEQTGVANILVSRLAKDNFIVVSPGANNIFDPATHLQLEIAIKNCDYLLLQLEINHQLIATAIRLAHKYRKKIMLNASPITELDLDLLKYVDWLIVNETELEYLTSARITNLQSLITNVNLVKKRGVKNVIVTLAANGCYLHSNKLQKHFKPLNQKITIVDSTAAGDAFIGGFFAKLFTSTHAEAIEYGMQAAEYAIQHPGAQGSLPHAKNLT